MQGLYLVGGERHDRRPKSKKEVREMIARGFGLERIIVEATSLHGNEFSGRLADAPVGTKVDFVGPDPYKSRKFYGRLTVTASGVKLS